MKGKRRAISRPKPRTFSKKKRPQEARPEAADRRGKPLLRNFTRASFGFGMPVAANLHASFPSLLVAEVSCRERRNDERKANGQRENGKNGFHGCVLRTDTEPGKRKIFGPGSERINRSLIRRFTEWRLTAKSFWSVEAAGRIRVRNFLTTIRT